MAATSAATLSIGTNVSLGRKVGSLSQSKPFGVRFNSQNSLKSFSGLKAATSVSCESDSSFLGEETIAALRGSIALKAQKENQSYQYHLQPQAAFKVAILGAAGGIGQRLALLIKMSPSRRELHLLISKQWLHKFQVFEVLTSLHQCVREM